MGLRQLIDRLRRRRDKGSGLIETMAGIGLASVIIGGPVLYFTTQNQAAAGTAATQGKNTSISEALDRTVATVQASDTILYAGPNELVTKGTEVDAGKPSQPVINRWVLNGTTLYQQVWAGDTQVAAYSRASLPTTAGSDANSMTRVAVESLVTDAPLFDYKGKDSAAISVAPPNDPLTQQARTNPADGKTTYDIALVDIALKATTVQDGTVQQATSVAPRGVSGKSDGSNTAAPCPAVVMSTTDGKPVVNWSALPGYTRYFVYRNSGATPAGDVTLPATATQGSWTDTTVVAGPSEVVNYTVKAVDSTGTVATGTCAPKPWSPQIDSPSFTTTSVLPAAPQATDWTSGVDAGLGLKAPRITLNWNAVAGADSYNLYYRELDPTTSPATPLTPGYTAAATRIPAGTTSFTTDNAGWGKEYEWYIEANARTGGSSRSAGTVMTLTHPAAPQNVTVTPQYGTGTDTTVNGYNQISWDPVPTAVRYEVWRYDSGSSGTVKKVGTTDARTLTYKDTVPYGTTYTYYVAAVNNGPRGSVTADASSADPEAGVTGNTGTMPTAAFVRKAGQGASVATLAVAHPAKAAFSTVAQTSPAASGPAPVTQLQYPPIPAVQGGSTRDYDGYNQLVWAPTLSATSYLVARSDVITGASTCLTGSACFTGSTGGITTTSLQDARPPGSQYDYAVKAVNATGPSVQFSLKARLTQRPPAPALKTTRAPSLTDRSSDFQIVQNADSGNDSSNLFCTSSTCSYQLSKASGVVATTAHTQSGANVDWTGVDSPDGSTTVFTARSKNGAVTNGGYSDPSTATVNTYPGSFWVSGRIGDANNNQARRFQLNVTNIQGLPPYSNGATAVQWGSSGGASNITITRSSMAGETPASTFPWGQDGYSSAAVLTDTTASTAGGTWDSLASPGAVFLYSATATAPNGLQRTVKSDYVVTPADTSKAGTLVVTCAGSDTRQFTQDQLGYTSDNSYYIPNHAMALPWGGQIIGSRLTWSDSNHKNSMDGGVLHGLAGETDYLGIQSIQPSVIDASHPSYNPSSSNPPGQTLGFTGWNYQLSGQWPGTPDMASGPGLTYYQGATAGFGVVTRGVSLYLNNPITGAGQTYKEPDSQYIQALNWVTGTFQNDSNCASVPLSPWPSGHSLVEPSIPCYTFNGTLCEDPAFWNRPQWWTH